MRAQLSVIVLILFGAGLVALGLIRFPYTVVEEEDAIIQISSITTLPVTATEQAVETLSQTYTLTTTTTMEKIETVTSTTYMKTMLGTIGPASISLGKPLIIGPFKVGVGETIEIVWSADSNLEVYVLSENEMGNSSPPTSWRAHQSGAENNLSYSPAGDTEVYVAAYTVDAMVNLSSLELNRIAVVNVSETYTTTITTPLTYVTTSTIYESRETTTTRLETSRIIYTTLIKTTVTETRYSDVSFTAFMGSFLIFVGVLLLFLLVRVIPRTTSEAEPSKSVQRRSS